jgi:hypothetical protein
MLSIRNMQPRDEVAIQEMTKAMIGRPSVSEAAKSDLEEL